MTRVAEKYLLQSDYSGKQHKKNIIWKMPKQQHLSKGQCDAFFIVRCVETHELKTHGTDSHLMYHSRTTDLGCCSDLL
jgi:hypothetical protein